MDWLQHISTFITGAGLLLSSFVSHPHHFKQTVVTPTPSITEAQTQSSMPSTSTYTASKTFSYQGYSITMNINVPKNGGKVTGSISGDCTGSIYGTYDGQDNGMVRGHADGTCQAFFLQIPGTVNFHGTVDKVNKTADLTVAVKVKSIEKSQNITFSFN